MQLDHVEGQPFFGLVESYKKNGIMLNTPRAIGFTVLELSKLVMLKTHCEFCKKVYGDKATLLCTDTDSLCYRIVSEDPFKEMLASKEVLFDLAKAFVEEEGYMKYCKTKEDTDALKRQLKEYKGKLGALELENDTFSNSEFVGLASKMFSL